MGFHNYNEPPTNINYLGNHGSLCDVTNCVGTKRFSLFGKLHKIQLNLAPLGTVLS